MSEVLVMYANQYRFPDEQTGEIREGTSAIFYDFSLAEKDKGLQFLKASLEYDSYSSLVGKLPGFFKPVQGRKIVKNKVQEEIIDFEFVRPFQFGQVK